jgi:crotonobetainyl-CoA:carnitine CoA-transferase CaiB-like acyl-CoA transferase
VECLADPQLNHREHFVTLSHPRGTSLIENTRFRMSATPPHASGAAPTLGEHTEHVLAQFLGYDDERIGDLAIAGFLE